MDSNKCGHCNKEKKLVCCNDCLWAEIFHRISESSAGDIAQRVSWQIEDKLDELKELIKTELKDKQIVCIKKGGKLIKI